MEGCQDPITEAGDRAMKTNRPFRTVTDCILWLFAFPFCMLLDAVTIYYVMFGQQPRQGIQTSVSMWWNELLDDIRNRRDES